MGQAQLRILPLGRALDDGYELHELHPMLTQEVVDLQWVLAAEAVNAGEDVVLDSMLLQQFQRLEHPGVGGLAIFAEAIAIMDLGRPVERKTYQEIVLCEKTAPFIGE